MRLCDFDRLTAALRLPDPDAAMPTDAKESHSNTNAPADKGDDTEN